MAFLGALMTAPPFGQPGCLDIVILSWEARAPGYKAE